MTDTTMNTGAASLSDDLNPEIVKATAQFIGKITGLVPPPNDAFPPEWHDYLRVFTKRLYEIAGMNATSAVHASAAPSELREAARQFHNLTQGDSAVIIRAPSAEKRDAIIAAGERLRAALTTPSPQADAAPDRCYAPGCHQWDGTGTCTCAAIAAGGAQEPVADQQIYDEFGFLEGLVNESTYRRIAETAITIYKSAPLPREAATVGITAARYIVIGYGETDHPQAAFVNEREQLLDAVLGMIYTHPSDACDETREEYRHDLADDDEWSHEGIWRTEFEIGGVVIYDLGAPPAASNGENK